jgi:6-phosphogluconolactonase
MIRHNSLAIAIAAVAAAAVPVAASAAPTHAAGAPALGAVYTASNDTAANSILVFDRLADGRLVPGASVDTGGRGSGSGLGNQGGVRLTPDERWLLAVNAGSNEVSVLAVGESSLTLTDVVSSAGSQPISVTANRDIVYVVNAASDSIAGFRLDTSGHLASIAGSVQSLGGSGTGPAEIAFSPDGNFLVVTEKNANKIAVFPVDRDGVAGAPLVQDSAGTTPFGFAFGKRGQLFVSEAFGGAANASATSSYGLGSDGILSTITPSAANTESSSCWSAVSPDGRFVYIANTGSGTVSGYRIAFDGHITLIDADGVTGVTGGRPSDLAFTQDGQFLYDLAGGTSKLAAFRVRADGSLEALPSFSDVPATANGLAVR